MKRRINWKNVMLLIVLLICVGVVLHDLAVIFITPIVTGHGVGFTWYGVITFIASIYTASDIVTYFKSI